MRPAEQAQFVNGWLTAHEDSLLDCWPAGRDKALSAASAMAARPRQLRKIRSVPACVHERGPKEWRALISYESVRWQQ